LLPSIGNAQVATDGPQPSVTPTVQTVYALQGGLDGFQPESGVIRDGKGNLYGATISGGNYAEGTVYKLIPPAEGSTIWTHNVLYSFPGYSGDGTGPVGSLVLDSSGALYGTTYQGGLYGGGIVFKLTPPVAEGDTWTETILDSFSFSGLEILQGLIEDAQGNLYGSTQYYDDATSNGGVFQLSPPKEPGGPWQETTLYVFSGASEPAGPSGNLILDSAGNLYGSSSSGGAFHLGTVFRLSPPSVPGGPWTDTILFSFSGVNTGCEPRYGVTFGPDGNLYGAAGTCNSPEEGFVVFDLTPSAVTGQPWSESLLHTFRGTFGASSSLTFDHKGALIGAYNETSCHCNEGAVFKLNPPAASGAPWTEGWLAPIDGFMFADLLMTPAGIPMKNRPPETPYNQQHR